MKKLLYILICAALIVEATPCAYPEPVGKLRTREQVRDIRDKMMDSGDFDLSFERLTALSEDHPGENEISWALGIAEYGRMNYSSAENFFQEALVSGAKGRIGEMLKYILKKMEENKSILTEIEAYRKELFSEAEYHRGDMIEKLNAYHITVLNSQLEEGRYYIYTVIPHLLWLRDNFGDVENIYKVLGEVYYSSYYYSAAADNYLIAFENEPENTDICGKLADSYVGAGNFELAGKYYDVLIKLYSDGGKKNNALVKRIKSIRQALPESYKDIGELIRDKKFTKAEQLARKRISLNPGDYVAITQLGIIYWDRGDKKQAIKLFRKVIRLAPDYPIARLFLGKAYFFERKPEKAIKEFEVFKEKMELVPVMDIQTTETYIQNLHYICYMYYTQKRYSEAMGECFKILEISPEDQRAGYNLAVLHHVHEHNRSKAYNELRRIIEIDPSSGIADQARYYIDYMRRNPDTRVVSDHSFIYEQ